MCSLLMGQEGPVRYYYNTLLATVRSHCVISLAMASSGTSARLLQGDPTVHSRLKILIRLNEMPMCGISKRTVLAKLIQSDKFRMKILRPMKFAAECINHSLRNMC